MSTIDAREWQKERKNRYDQKYQQNKRDYNDRKKILKELHGHNFDGWNGEYAGNYSRKKNRSKKKPTTKEEIKKAKRAEYMREYMSEMRKKRKINPEQPYSR